MPRLRPGRSLQELFLEGNRMKKTCLLVLVLCFMVVGCGKKQVGSSSTSQLTTLSAEEQQRLEAERQRQLQEQELREREAGQQWGSESGQWDQNMTQAARKIESMRIFFAFDSFELNSEGRSVLQDVSKTMRTYRDLRMRIEGHCDERGTAEYNMALGERRARAVYDFLVVLGVEPRRLQVLSFGEEVPLDPGHNESAWAKNRRAEFRFLN